MAHALAFRIKTPEHYDGNGEHFAKVATLPQLRRDRFGNEYIGVISTYTLRKTGRDFAANTDIFTLVDEQTLGGNFQALRLTPGRGRVWLGTLPHEERHNGIISVNENVPGDAAIFFEEGY